MNSKIILALFCCLYAEVVRAATNPLLSAWKQSKGVGFNNYTADVTKIQYTTTAVYISANSIPSYSIGPWSNNPNTAAPQNNTWVFSLTPTKNTGTLTAVSMGAIGLWINGMQIFNANDAKTYNSLGVWHQNALLFEGVSFDACYGHPASGGVYHTHVNPACLYTTVSTAHSPLIGFYFDSYPIYGPYGYSNATNANSAIKLLQSSYELRAITARTTLANGTVLNSTYYGPSLSTYSLGHYLEDYVYTAGYGDLDSLNGRWCVTPDYPSGTYAYFVTVTSAFAPQFPYTIGPSYYGVVNRNDMGPSSGYATIPTTATSYFSATSG